MTIANEDTKLTNILENQRKHWANVVSELIDGYKLTHWCWYFLPNVPGLGKSEESQYFAVTLDEFSRYMENPEYRGNIFTVVYLIDKAYRNHSAMDLTSVLGEVDALKFRSFMTLFRQWYYHGNDIGSTKMERIVAYSLDVYGSCDHTTGFING